MQDGSRALVAFSPLERRRFPIAGLRTPAAFTAQLLAASLDAPAYRARRREAAALAAAIYRERSTSTKRACSTVASA